MTKTEYITVLTNTNASRSSVEAKSVLSEAIIADEVDAALTDKNPKHFIMLTGIRF